MSEATHSPGPWQAIAADDGGFDIADSNGEWVAEEIDDEADARLIAAAPALLAALKEAVACVEYCRRAHKDIQSGDGIPVELFWKDLIAKAEGRAP